MERDTTMTSATATRELVGLVGLVLVLGSAFIALLLEPAQASAIISMP